jgi:hypothetical protein
MKVVINIPNVYYEEKSCDDFMLCLAYYLMYITKYSKQLGLCYGLNYVDKFPEPGEYKNRCVNGYVEIVV